MTRSDEHGKLQIKYNQIFCDLSHYLKHTAQYELEYKWPAVAAQTARNRCNVLSIQYAYYFRAYQRQWNGR